MTEEIITVTDYYIGSFKSQEQTSKAHKKNEADFAVIGAQLNIL